MAPPSILVLGAGELGGAVLRSLATHPARGDTQMTVLKRSGVATQPEAAKKRHELRTIEDLGIKLLHGDTANDSLEQLASVFGEFHTVVSCAGMTMPSGTQLKLAKAAIRGGVKRYFPWQFGGDYDRIGRGSAQTLFDEQLDVRELLRGQSRMDWVIVSAGMFTSFLFEPAFGLVNAERTVVSAIGSWENRITVTSPHDIGRLTAEIVLACPDIQGVVYIAGDTVSTGQLADVVENAKGEKVVRRLRTITQLEDDLAAAPDDTMCKYRLIFARSVGVSWDKADTFNAAQGISTQTVEQWVEENL